MTQKEIELLNKKREAAAMLKRRHPYHFFEPNPGKITVEGRAFLKRYLKEVDIPEYVDSQLNVLLSGASVRGVSGGNRSGKSITGTISGIIRSTGELPRSLEPFRDKFTHIIDRTKNKVVMGRVTAVDAKQLQRVVLPLWEHFLSCEEMRHYLYKGNFWDSYSKEFDILTLYRGKEVCAKIEFLTNSQEVKSSQGGDLDWAVFDEEPERAKWKETLMRFGTADRLDIEIDWTPTEGLTWATDLFHNELFEKDDDESEIKDKELFKLTPVTNPYVMRKNQDGKIVLQAIMDNFAKVASYEEMKMRLLGEAVSLSGLVYSGLFNEREHMIDPFPITEDYIIYRGLDPHLVKASVCVETALDREGIEYVCGMYQRQADTQEIKDDLIDRVRARGYRLGKTKCDKSANSSIQAFGGRNIFKELSTGKNAIPSLDISEKFTGSIHAGVDEIKKRLKIDPLTKKPRFFIFNTAELRPLVHAMRTLERETYANEDKKGMKDRIAEGKHDAHAALRYIHQMQLNWLPPVIATPEYQHTEENIAY